MNLFHRADSAFDGCVACEPCCFNSPPRCKNNKRKKKLIFPPLPASAAYCRPFCSLPSPLPCWALFYRDCQASWDIECHCGCLIVTARAGCRGVNTTAVLYFFFFFARPLFEQYFPLPLPLDGKLNVFCWLFSVRLNSLKESQLNPQTLWIDKQQVIVTFFLLFFPPHAQLTLCFNESP